MSDFVYATILSSVSVVVSLFFKSCASSAWTTRTTKTVLQPMLSILWKLETPVTDVALLFKTAQAALKKFNPLITLTKVDMIHELKDFQIHYKFSTVRSHQCKHLSSSQDLSPSPSQRVANKKGKMQAVHLLGSSDPNWPLANQWSARIFPFLLAALWDGLGDESREDDKCSGVLALTVLNL